MSQTTTADWSAVLAHAIQTGRIDLPLLVAFRAARHFTSYQNAEALAWAKQHIGYAL